MTLERAITKPGEAPDGEGWHCIHAGASYDMGRYWLWQRVVHHGPLCGQDGAGGCTCGTTNGKGQ